MRKLKKSELKRVYGAKFGSGGNSEDDEHRDNAESHPDTDLGRPSEDDVQN